MTTPTPQHQRPTTTAPGAPTNAVELLLNLPGITMNPIAAWCIRLLDSAMDAGDTCLVLAQAIQREDAPCADVANCVAALSSCGLVHDSHDYHQPLASIRLPLVLHDGLLSSRRYWHYEQEIAHILLRHAQSASMALFNDDEIAADISTLFPRSAKARVNGVDWQRVAACVALHYQAAIITGGPGCGKTTVAGRVIAALARQATRAQQTCTVVIAAPTGKAAQRLRESLLATGQQLVKKSFITADQLQQLTNHVATLHRLLYDPIMHQAQVVVMDEVSMADAATLSRVLQRVAPHARLLLLGDQQQLASVEAGHVLAELCRWSDHSVSSRLGQWYFKHFNETLATNDQQHPLAHIHVHLQKNWRSGSSPAVAELAKAMQQSSLASMCLLAEPAYLPSANAVATDNSGHPVWVERRDCDRPAQVIHDLCTDALSWAQAVVQAANPSSALATHGERRILCAMRVGPLGTEVVNDAIEQALIDAHAIQVWDNGHYHGQPLLITRNDYDLQIFNGDIGVVWGDRLQAEVWFPDDAGGLRAIALHRLHAAEPVFAMSIHKSQGSQFQQVDVVTAPHDRGQTGQLLTRELLYTGVTRAAYAARIWANSDVLSRTLDRSHVRHTGLGRFLRAYKEG